MTTKGHWHVVYINQFYKEDICERSTYYYHHYLC